MLGAHCDGPRQRHSRRVTRHPLSAPRGRTGGPKQAGGRQHGSAAKKNTRRARFSLSLLREAAAFVRVHWVCVFVAATVIHPLKASAMAPASCGECGWAEMGSARPPRGDESRGGRGRCRRRQTPLPPLSHPRPRHLVSTDPPKPPGACRKEILDQMIGRSKRARACGSLSSPSPVGGTEREKERTRSEQRAFFPSLLLSHPTSLTHARTLSLSLSLSLSFSLSRRVRRGAGSSPSAAMWEGGRSPPCVCSACMSEGKQHVCALWLSRLPSTFGLAPVSHTTRPNSQLTRDNF